MYLKGTLMKNHFAIVTEEIINGRTRIMIRCSKCGHVIGELKDSTIETKCNFKPKDTRVRCKTINIIKV